VRPTKFTERNYPKDFHFKIVKAKLNPETWASSWALAIEYRHGKPLNDSRPIRIRNGVKDKWEVVERSDEVPINTQFKLYRTIPPAGKRAPRASFQGKVNGAM
jgi:hypothetical protein